MMLRRPLVTVLVIIIDISLTASQRQRERSLDRRYTKSQGVNGGSLYFDEVSGDFVRSPVTPEPSSSRVRLTRRNRLNRVNGDEDKDKVEAPKRLTKVLKRRRKFKTVSRQDYLERLKETEGRKASDTAKKIIRYETSDELRKESFRNDIGNSWNDVQKHPDEESEDDQQNAPGPQYETSASDKRYQHFKNAEDVLLESAHHNQLYVEKYYNTDGPTQRTKPTYDYTIGTTRGDGLDNHQMYPTSTVATFPGMYFPPENGIQENPYKYHFTIGDDIPSTHPLLSSINTLPLPVATTRSPKPPHTYYPIAPAQPARGPTTMRPPVTVKLTKSPPTRRHIDERSQTTPRSLTSGRRFPHFPSVETFDNAIGTFIERSNNHKEKTKSPWRKATSKPKLSFAASTKSPRLLKNEQFYNPTTKKPRSINTGSYYGASNNAGYESTIRQYTRKPKVENKKTNYARTPNSGYYLTSTPSYSHTQPYYSPTTSSYTETTTSPYYATSKKPRHTLYEDDPESYYYDEYAGDENEASADKSSQENLNFFSEWGRKISGPKYRTALSKPGATTLRPKIRTAKPTLGKKKKSNNYGLPPKSTTLFNDVTTAPYRQINYRPPVGSYPDLYPASRPQQLQNIEQGYQGQYQARQKIKSDMYNEPYRRSHKQPKNGYMEDLKSYHPDKEKNQDLIHDPYEQKLPFSNLIHRKPYQPALTFLTAENEPKSKGHPKSYGPQLPIQTPRRGGPIYRQTIPLQTSRDGDKIAVRNGMVDSSLRFSNQKEWYSPARDEGRHSSPQVHRLGKPLSSRQQERKKGQLILDTETDRDKSLPIKHTMVTKQGPTSPSKGGYKIKVYNTDGNGYSITDGDIDQGDSDVEFRMDLNPLGIGGGAKSSKSRRTERPGRKHMRRRPRKGTAEQRKSKFPNFPYFS